MKTKKSSKIPEIPTKTQQRFIELANSICVNPGDGNHSLEHRFKFYQKYSQGTLLKQLKRQVGLETLASWEYLSTWQGCYILHKPIYCIREDKNRAIYCDLFESLEKQGFIAEWTYIENHHYVQISLQQQENKEEEE